MSYHLQKRRRGEHGNRPWREIDSNDVDRAPLDAKAFTNNELDRVFEWAVFEQLESPAPESP